MAIRKIRKYGDPILRKKAKAVPAATNRIIQLLEDMRDTLDLSEGVGLAAPQVGVLKRVVIVRLPDEEQVYELINPQVIERCGSQVKLEACLSLPGENGYVERPERIVVEYLNRFGETRIVEGEDLLAIILSHELDHLDGVMYVDKLTDKPEGAEDDDD